MIEVITGVPGSGKTSLVVAKLMALKGARPVFVAGIPGLKVPHEEVPEIEKWTEIRPHPQDASLQVSHYVFPPNSLVVLDEAQNFFRVRPATSKVPNHVAALETHRHTGIDFVLLTQHPSLLDANVKRFVNKYTHIRQTPMARYKYEWTELVNPELASAREIATKDRYKPAKATFAMYKSSELHTKLKTRLPWYYYVFALAVLTFLGASYYAFNRVKDKQKPQDLSILEARTKGGAVPTGNSAAPLSKEQYIAAYEPRIFGRPDTAPIYDQVTQPKTAPEPVACYESERTGCKCITQQGTTYETTEQVCKKIIKTGDYFKPWKEPLRATVQGERSEAGTVARGESPDREGKPILPAPRFVDAQSLNSG